LLLISTARYLREYLRPGSFAVEVTEGKYERGGDELDASFFALRSRRRSPPGWVVLHGLTAVGRQHPSLQRFARALAATGATVMVPDIPEWRDLRLATAITVPTIRSALRHLAQRPDVDHARVGIIGFSFGATQALIAAADPRLHTIVRGIAAWGGYRDVHRLFEFGVTGEHELDGVRYQMQPDPYSRWIIGANYLTGMPGFEDYHDVADALRELALEAGIRRVYAWDPSYDPDKARVRQRLRAEHRSVFDLIAPHSQQPIHDPRLAREIAHGLADVALRAEPWLDPGPFLEHLGVRTVIAHGRDDRLIPFTESIRLAREIPPSRLAGATITSLFAHSGGPRLGLGLVGIPLETVRFVRMLDGILTLL
jgi:pimeloyl-ACP methyl ester carboxylesterase